MAILEALEGDQKIRRCSVTDLPLRRLYVGKLCASLNGALEYLADIALEIGGCRVGAIGRLRTLVQGTDLFATMAYIC